MTGVGVSGADELELLGRRLKDAEPQIRKEMLAAFRAAGKPVVVDIRAGILATFPSKGGLANRAARTPIGLRTRLAGKSTGVRIAAPGKKGLVTKRSLTSIEASGSWRHPVYGNRKAWVGQTESAAKDWFSEPIENSAPMLRRKLLAAMDRTNAELVRGI